jgi:hypothetical protein
MKKLITTTLIIIFLVNTAMSQIFDGINLKENTQSLIEKLENKNVEIALENLKEIKNCKNIRTVVF